MRKVRKIHEEEEFPLPQNMASDPACCVHIVVVSPAKTIWGFLGRLPAAFANASLGLRKGQKIVIFLALKVDLEQSFCAEAENIDLFLGPPHNRRLLFPFLDM